MYMILWWKDKDNFLTHIANEDGSIKLFNAIEEADKYANKHYSSDNLRVISIGSAR